MLKEMTERISKDLLTPHFDFFTAGAKINSGDSVSIKDAIALPAARDLGSPDTRFEHVNCRCSVDFAYSPKVISS